MLYMVIEHLKDPKAIYRRLRDEGRALPDGLRYIASWVEPNYARCWQVMEPDDRALLEEWTLHARDLVDFELFPVRTSAEAAAAIAPEL
jgi:hypothetical protein